MKSNDKNKIVKDIINYWKKNDFSRDGIAERFMDKTSHLSDREFFILRDQLEEQMFQILKKKYEILSRDLSRGEKSKNWGTPFEAVYARLVLIFGIQIIEAYKKGSDTELARIVKDPQNIHTEVVNKLMNDNLKLIENLSVPKNQETLDEILTAWTSNGIFDIKDVYEDMKYWESTRSIFQKNDYLYKNKLKMLWFKIKSYQSTSETYHNLVIRLYEECKESLGMCGQGHIARLANVLVGFDEDYVPPLSMDVFQNKMAIISNQEISIEEKIKEANNLFDEYKIEDKEKRQEWLDAFA
jgi:hypothetical protein